jgi:hypothetical protein
MMAFETPGKSYIVNSEIAYKMNLSNQIDRINMLLSTRLESNVINIIESFKMLVAAQRNSVDALESMYSPYQDKEYDQALKTLEDEYETKMNDKNEHSAIVAEQEFTEKKYALIMQCIDRGDHLLPHIKRAVREGFLVDREETTEEVK